MGTPLDKALVLGPCMTKTCPEGALALATSGVGPRECGVPPRDSGLSAVVAAAKPPCRRSASVKTERCR